MNAGDSVGRVVRDGKVAVLVSPGFGSGWSHGEDKAERRDWMLFSPELVALFDMPKTQRNWPAIEALVAQVLGDDLYTGGLYDVEIEWVERGRLFHVHEYDGFESLEFFDEVPWSTP